MDIHQVITNTNGWGVGFQQVAGWAYATPASYYFWAGFTLVFASGLVSIGWAWTRRLIGAGGEQ